MGFASVDDLSKVLREGINESLVLGLRSAQYENFQEIQDRKERIEKTVNEYISLSRRHYTSSFHGLLLADIKGLANHLEIREAINRIERQTGRHPLGKTMASRLEGIDLKKLFDILTFDDFHVLKSVRPRAHLWSRAFVAPDRMGLP